MKAVIKRHQAAIDKLDPEWKSFSFIGWQQQGADERAAMIGVYLSEHFPDTDYGEIRTISRGKEASAVTIVEFYSRADRDEVLKWCKAQGNPKMLGGTIRADYAKTAKQLTRNWAMKKANDLIKADGRSSGPDIVINWKIEGSKDRSVTVNGFVAFLQEKQDSIGTFSVDFEHLTVE